MSHFYLPSTGLISGLLGEKSVTQRWEVGNKAMLPEISDFTSF